MFDKDWEFADIVWPALGRMLLSVCPSQATWAMGKRVLEFQDDTVMPDELRVVGTWVAPGRG